MEYAEEGDIHSVSLVYESICRSLKRLKFIWLRRKFGGLGMRLHWGWNTYMNRILFIEISRI